VILFGGDPSVPIVLQVIVPGSEENMSSYRTGLVGILAALLYIHHLPQILRLTLEKSWLLKVINMISAPCIICEEYLSCGQCTTARLHKKPKRGQQNERIKEEMARIL